MVYGGRTIDQLCSRGRVVANQKLRVDTIDEFLTSAANCSFGNERGSRERTLLLRSKVRAQLVETIFQRCQRRCFDVVPRQVLRKVDEIVQHIRDRWLSSSSVDFERLPQFAIELLALEQTGSEGCSSSLASSST